MNAAPERGRPQLSHGSAGNGRLTAFAFLLAVAALALAAVNWISLKRDATQRESDMAALNQRLEALQQSAAQKSTLDAESAGTQQALKVMGDRLDGFDETLTDLRRRTQEGRDAWIKAEAATLLLAAGEELQMRGDPALAIQALQQADDRLRLLQDPRLIAVRQEIARETSALRAVPQPDTAGMAVALASMAESAERLPLKRSAPDHYTPGGSVAPDALPPGTGLWDRFKAASARLFADMFTVRHHNVPVEPLLAPREEFFLRRNLELRLDAARASLLERQDRAFQDSVHAARDWLAAYFDTQDASVKAAIQSLEGMQAKSIAPPLPDLSASLALLRQTESPRTGAP